jgi:excisionase family DNA binding protein
MREDSRRFEKALSMECSPLRRLAEADLPASLQPDPLHATKDVRGTWWGGREAADHLGLSRTTLWRYAREGRIKSIVMGTPRKPQYKFLRTDVEAFKKVLDEKRSERAARWRKRVKRAVDAFWRALKSGTIDLRRLMAMPGADYAFEINLDAVLLDESRKPASGRRRGERPAPAR